MSRLEIGAKAPAFDLPNQDGKTISLTDFSGERFVIYFYPADDTPGCTKEACQFNDGLAAYREIIPASRDLLAPGGLIALEVGAGQHSAVESLLTGTFGAPVKVRLDLDGCRRVVLACPGR